MEILARGEVGCDGNPGEGGVRRKEMLPKGVNFGNDDHNTSIKVMR